MKLATLLLALLLTACGGGGDDEDDAKNPTPAANCAATPGACK